MGYESILFLDYITDLVYAKVFDIIEASNVTSEFADLIRNTEIEYNYRGGASSTYSSNDNRVVIRSGHSFL